MCMVIFDPALAIENLVGDLLGYGLVVWVVWAIFSFLMRKTRKNESVAPSPFSAPSSAPASSPPAPSSTALLNALKEEMFSLERERLSDNLTPEKYAEAKASLETRLKQAYDSPALESGQLAPMPTTAEPYTLEPPEKVGATTIAELPTVPSPLQESKGAGKGRYALTGVLVFIFAALLAMNMFTFLSELDSNPEKAGESVGKSIFPMMFWLVMAFLAWRGIKSREPETEPHFRVRHRRFMIAVSVTSIALFASGIGLGIWNSGRIKTADAIRKISADNADLNAKGAEFRRQLYQIRHRETPTMRDYYDQCAEVEKLLNDYEPNRQRALDGIHKAEQILPPDEKSGTAMLVGVDEIFRLDDQIILDLRQEVAYSKVLMELPNRQQAQFYRNNIQPLYEHENDLADKEAKKLEELRKSGVKIPAEMLP